MKTAALDINAEPSKSELTKVFLGYKIPPPPLRPVSQLLVSCAWCDNEAGIRREPHTTSHTICLAHLASNLADSRGKGDFDTLYWSVLTAIATKEEA